MPIFLGYQFPSELTAAIKLRQSIEAGAAFQHYTEKLLHGRRKNVDQQLQIDFLNVDISDENSKAGKCGVTCFFLVETFLIDLLYIFISTFRFGHENPINFPTGKCYSLSKFALTPTSNILGQAASRCLVFLLKSAEGTWKWGEGEAVNCFSHKRLFITLIYINCLDFYWRGTDINFNVDNKIE